MKFYSVEQGEILSFYVVKICQLIVAGMIGAISMAIVTVPEGGVLWVANGPMIFTLVAMFAADFGLWRLIFNEHRRVDVVDYYSDDDDSNEPSQTTKATQ